MCPSQISEVLPFWSKTYSVQMALKMDWKIRILRPTETPASKAVYLGVPIAQGENGRVFVFLPWLQSSLEHQTGSSGNPVKWARGQIRSGSNRNGMKRKPGLTIFHRSRGVSAWVSVELPPIPSETS